MRLIDLQNELSTRNRALYIALRGLREQLWTLPGIGKWVYPTPEIAQLRDIVRHSPPDLLKSTQGGPKVLFFNFRGGWSTNLTEDLIIASALRMRGAEPHFVTCGAYLLICDIANCKVAPPMPCTFCAAYVHKMVPLLNFPLACLSDFIEPGERTQAEREIAALPLEALADYTYQNVPVGALCNISVPRFLLRGDVDDSPFSRDVFRRFVTSGAIIVPALRRLFDQINPDLLWTMNGLFFSEKIAQWIAQERGISFVNYEAGFGPLGSQSIVIARDQIANHYNLNSHWEAAKERPLLPEEIQAVETYLTRRRTGQDEIIANVYYPQMESEAQAIREQLQLNTHKPLVLLLTNILWDSAALQRNTLFNGILHWLEVTIRHFIANPTHQLVVRVHPAEVGLVMQESQSPISNAVRTMFPELPSHIKIVEATSSLSSYTLMEMADYGIVYTSTTGLEMTLMRKPVVVAGETHYAGKGLTYDPPDIPTYLQWLSDPHTHLGPVTEPQFVLGLRYAYLFFFKMMYPFPYVKTYSQRRIKFLFSDLNFLSPGQTAALDKLCDAILHKTSPGMLLYAAT